MAKMSIAVLGAGNVGGALARVWASAGYSVTFGLPDPRGEKARAAVAALGGKVRAARNQDAVALADVVALCALARGAGGHSSVRELERQGAD